MKVILIFLYLDVSNNSKNLQEMVTPNSAKNGNFIIINPKNSNIIVNNNNISLNNSDANDNKNESNSDILKNILNKNDYLHDILLNSDNM